MGSALQQKYYSMVFTGQQCSKMHICMCNTVISARGQGTSRRDIKCLCKTFKRLMCLIVGELILWARYQAHCLMSIFW